MVIPVYGDVESGRNKKYDDKEGILRNDAKNYAIQ